MAAALAMREHLDGSNDLVERLETDDRLGLAPGTLAALFAEPLRFTGNAVAQSAAFVDQVEALARRYPAAAAYAPAPIL